MEQPMEGVARSGTALFLRGLVAIGFAIVAWARPGHTLTILLVLVGAYLIGDGMVALGGALRAARGGRGWGLMAFEGVLGVALGVFTLARPLRAMAIAFVLVAVWALCTGVIELIEAGRLRRHIPNEWLLGASGLVRFAFGIVLLTRPGAGALTLLWIAAAYALIEGILLIGLSLRLSRYGAGRRGRAGGMTPQPA